MLSAVTTAARALKFRVQSVLGECVGLNLDKEVDVEEGASAADAAGQQAESGETSQGVDADKYVPLYAIHMREYIYQVLGDSQAGAAADSDLQSIGIDGRNTQTAPSVNKAVQDASVTFSGRIAAITSAFRAAPRLRAPLPACARRSLTCAPRAPQWACSAEWRTWRCAWPRRTCRRRR